MILLPVSQNEKEADCCVRIAAQLGVKDWRIITGYDAQRQMIENKLKIAKVPWEDKVFNVDSCVSWLPNLAPLKLTELLLLLPL